MVKRYDKEMRNPGPFLPQRLMLVERKGGPFILSSDGDVLLALIAEMKKVVFAAAGQYPHDSQAEFEACMALVSRAEALLA